MAQQSFEEVIDEIRRSISRFEKIEGKPWGVEGAVIELAKQVGQLSALVMNREGYYFTDRDKLDDKYDSSDDQIADELADIMFAVVRIADYYGINLEETNRKTRKDEDTFLKTRGVWSTVLGVAVKAAGVKGRGVFADRTYQTGDCIEECPVLVLDSQDRDVIDKTKLYNYYYAWGKDGKSAAIALGYGSLYNHSYTPNARYDKDAQKEAVRIVALAKINIGDEITINYNGKPDDTSKLWFDVHE